VAPQYGSAQKAASIKMLKLTRIFLDFIDLSLELEFGKKYAS